MNMDGTTLCPHCETRFKISETQLDAHHGMVRCGQCLQAFDARPGYVPDQPSPQLELPILHETAPAETPVIDEPDTVETSLPASIALEEEIQIAEITQPEISHNEPTDFIGPLAASAGINDEEKLVEPHPAKAVVLQPVMPAEQISMQNEEGKTFQAERPSKYWTIAALLLAPLLLVQATYFFRVDLAARLPGLKPALVGFCQLLNCSVPLPQTSSLMSIESSELESSPTHENLITLNALLRNRAPYAQAFPNLELTLNDTQDKPLARRIFKPVDYLPPIENEMIGLLANYELNIKLHLDTTSLKPTGYRLVLFYPNGN